MIHLDTGFLIRALVPGSPQDRQLRAWLQAGRRTGISAIGWAEFLCGPIDGALVDFAARIVREPVAFLPEDATATALLFNRAGRRRGTMADCMIAAVALRVGAELATANATDFQRLEEVGLRVLVAAP